MAKTSTRDQAAANKDLILTGNMLAIDPSSTSFGYAIFKNGKLQDKGCKKYKGIISIRLNRIFSDIYQMTTDCSADILAIERLRSGGGYSPPQLLWSVGAAMAACPMPVIEVSPMSWKSAAKVLELEKDDANDAHAIGYRLIQFAKGEA